jgi:hypothetical protein
VLIDRRSAQMICSRHDERVQPEPQRKGCFDAGRRIRYQLGRSSWAAWHGLNIHKYRLYNVIVRVS